jgi:nucleoside-diphosphate-sugar epimerase
MESFWAPSMVFGKRDSHPDARETYRRMPPRTSTYGFRKFACEYFAHRAYEQYGLPHTIIRPFNCVGTGEQRALGGREIPSGNVKLAMRHVVPGLIQKVARSQHLLHILGDAAQVRRLAHGGDLAYGIRLCMSTRPRSIRTLTSPSPSARPCWNSPK